MKYVHVGPCIYLVKSNSTKIHYTRQTGRLWVNRQQKQRAAWNYLCNRLADVGEQVQSGRIGDPARVWIGFQVTHNQTVQL